jgi:hypothetical protein
MLPFASARYTSAAASKCTTAGMKTAERGASATTADEDETAGATFSITDEIRKMREETKKIGGHFSFFASPPMDHYRYILDSSRFVGHSLHVDCVALRARGAVIREHPTVLDAAAVAAHYGHADVLRAFDDYTRRDPSRAPTRMYIRVTPQYVTACADEVFSVCGETRESVARVIALLDLRPQGEYTASPDGCIDCRWSVNARTRNDLPLLFTDTGGRGYIERSASIYLVDEPWERHEARKRRAREERERRELERERERRAQAVLERERNLAAHAARVAAAEALVAEEARREAREDDDRRKERERRAALPAGTRAILDGLDTLHAQWKAQDADDFENCRGVYDPAHKRYCEQCCRAQHYDPFFQLDANIMHRLCNGCRLTCKRSCRQCARDIANWALVGKTVTREDIVEQRRAVLWSCEGGVSIRVAAKLSQDAAFAVAAAGVQC